MPVSRATHAVGFLAKRIPVIKRLPVMRLLMLGEVAVLAREHIERLTPAERRRLVVLMREARGRPSHLPVRDRDELQALIAKAEPRLFAGAAAGKLSPIPLPSRITHPKR